MDAASDGHSKLLRIVIRFPILRKVEAIGEKLRSIRPVADEIVIVDTGSRDRTVEIAKRCGASIRQFPLNDDFSAARYFAQRWFPDSPPLLWLLAQQCFAENDFTRAAKHLERLNHLGQTGKYDSTLSFDPRILGEDAIFNLAACHLRLAHLDKAQKLFEQLLVSPTRGHQARQNLALIEQLRSDQ